MQMAKFVLETMGDLLIHVFVAILDDLQSMDLPSALLFWHTDSLSIHLVGIGILLLSHTDELVNHPKEIETILHSYGLASNSWQIIPKATDKLVSLRKSSEIATSLIS